MTPTTKALVMAGLLLAAGSAQADIKIGFSAVLSGPQAAQGQDQYDGFMLAVEQLGGKFGDQKVSVVNEDDQLKPDVGSQILQKFLERDKVDAVVGLGYSNILMAQTRRIKESGVVAISTVAGPAPIAGKLCMPNLFVMGWQNDGMSEAMGQYVKDKGYKNVYLMSSNYQAGKDKLAGFKRYYGGPVANEVYTPLGQLDYSAEISQLQTAKPDALFAFYTGAIGVNVVRQLSQAGLMGKLPFFSDSLIEANTLAAMKNSAIGAIYGSPWATVLDNPQNKKFVDGFKAKYQRTPSEYAVNGYDAAYLLDAAVRKLNGKVSDKKAFADAVKSVGGSFPTVRGKFRFNTNNMPVQNYYAFEIVPQGDSFAVKQLAQVFTDHQDAYVNECKP
ncbi:ABC transporter substrate-binding protein [Pigmentiphaga litoralis]|uniref:Branched-chain amino acid transport system substrate-binding protein n=1 Tax=Pigmentiphaga litoralis TaxID=516702 RepID=A0A7Y9IUT9_9BURK|nr:ABC transporter substrate-binding protein [Pigmentiphaga litoralis]NYE23488.1 branched-chain amino acid transport system substrate-binding protein [Pigmentiphaga litoralis]NYE82898.1 branched-chain amino acid transport system substrate-binding protein [Pigmentiphaga litoralis]